MRDDRAYLQSSGGLRQPPGGPKLSTIRNCDVAARLRSVDGHLDAALLHSSSRYAFHGDGRFAQLTNYV